MNSQSKDDRPRRTRQNKIGPGMRVQFEGERKVVMLVLKETMWTEIERLANWKQGDPRAIFNTQNAFHDHAVRWFAHGPAKKGYDRYLTPIVVTSEGAARRTYWLQSEIWKDAEGIATRDGISINRVLHTAIVAYLDHLLTEAAAKASVRSKAKKSKRTKSAKLERRKR